MLDYASLHALATVVREGSFERAARALHVTPSAVVVDPDGNAASPDHCTSYFTASAGAIHVNEGGLSGTDAPSAGR